MLMDLSTGSLSLSPIAIFASTLGLSLPWQITSVSFAKDEKRLDICIDFLDVTSPPCPNCGCGGAPCRKETETWYHSNFFHYETYLHAQVPHTECCDSIIPVERPWSRKGSKFSLLP
jgi:transposase